MYYAFVCGMKDHKVIGIAYTPLYLVDPLFIDINAVWSSGLA